MVLTQVFLVVPLHLNTKNHTFNLTTNHIHTTNMRHNKFLFLSLLAAGVALSSCTEESFSIPQSELYAREFIKKFGVPDANHTWSMAGSTYVTVSLDSDVTGTLEVYSDIYPSETSRLLARVPFSGSVASADIDTEVDTPTLYVRVLDNHGMTVCDEIVSVQNGKARSGGNSASRAAVTIGKLPEVADFSYEVYIMEKKSIDYLYANRDRYTTHEQAAEGYNKETGGWLNAGPTHLTGVENVKLLKGLYHVDGKEYRWKQLKPVFCEYTDADGARAPGVFAEGIDHVAKYYHNSSNGVRLDADVTFRVLAEGPVTMECIWRGTQFGDYLGYYYYPADKVLSPADLWNLPKYIFLTPKDIKDASTLTRCALYNDRDGWRDWENLDGMGSGHAPYWHDETKMMGTKYSLAYYGDDYKGEGSYIFPAGVKIGYFLLTDHGQKIYFSDCELNYYINNSTWFESRKGPKERPFAAKFTYDHRTYLGFGDGSGDKDLNDVVFVVGNVVPVPDDITPDVIRPKAQRWTIACEDLGSTDDFDFNDIVMEIEYAKGSGVLTFIPRAAGGNLASEIYFNGKNLGEIHAMLNTRPGVITNVYQGGATVDPSTVKPITVKVDEDWTLTQPVGGFFDLFKVYTYNNGTQNTGSWLESSVSLPGAGPLPQMMLLREGWYWATEQSNIANAYTRFPDWTRDQANFDWDSQRQPGLTVSYR